MSKSKPSEHHEIPPTETEAAVQPAGQRPDISGPVIAGLAIIFVFFGLFGAWAALAPLQSAAIAPGLVSVDTNRKTIQHFEGGIVGQILVREGDKVQTGQILIRLDEIQARSTLDLLRGRMNSAVAREARLKAERDGSAEIRFPDWLEAKREAPKVTEILDGQVNIFQARKLSTSGQVAILERRIAQFSEEIEGLEGQIKAEDRQIDLIERELTDVKRLVDKGLARRPRLLELQRRSAEIEGSRHRNQARIARARQQIGEAELRITELQTEKINEVVAELREVQAEILDLTEQLRAATDVLRRTEIRAPIAGTVVGQQVHTTGGVIAPGEPLMEVVPSEDRLVIEAKIDPVDIDIVRQGLPAQVRFSAFSQRNQVPVEGTVMSVSADSLTDERSGQPFYLARVELTGDPTMTLDGAALYPGMQAEVIVVTGERTALSYLVRPLLRSFNRALREE